MNSKARPEIQNRACLFASSVANCDCDERRGNLAQKRLIATCQMKADELSLRSIEAILDNRSVSGVYRLAMLAIADGGGEASIESICRWVNCTSDSASSLLDDMEHMGLVSVEYCDDSHTIRYFSQWLIDLTYPPTKSANERSRYIPESVREAVKEKSGYACTYCGCEDGEFHIDHIVPFSKGGTNDESNLTLACASCNISKRDKTLEEWEGRK